MGQGTVGTTPPRVMTIAGTVDARVGRSDANRKKMAVLPKESSRGKRAVTHYKTLQRLEGCALLECRDGSRMSGQPPPMLEYGP